MSTDFILQICETRTLIEIGSELLGSAATLAGIAHLESYNMPLDTSREESGFASCDPRS